MLGRRSLLLVALCFAIGCGGDDDDSLGGFSSDEVLGDLSADEYIALCEASDRYAQASANPDDAQHVLCLLEASSTIYCQITYDACIEEPIEYPEPDCEDDRLDSTNCSATVGEVQACVDEGIASFSQFKAYDCDDLEGFFMALENASESGACALVEENCPTTEE